jgi:hypothetical protein
LKEDAQDRSLCRTGFGRGCEPVVGQNAKWMSAVRKNGGLSGHVSNFISWSLIWDMRSDVRSVPSTLWPTSTVRDNSIYSPDFRHNLFSLCRAARNTLTVPSADCHRTTYKAAPKRSVHWIGPVKVSLDASWDLLNRKTRRQHLKAQLWEAPRCHLSIFFIVENCEEVSSPNFCKHSPVLLSQPPTPPTVAFWHSKVTCINDSQFYRHFRFVFCSEATSSTDTSCSLVCVPRRSS